MRDVGNDIVGLLEHPLVAPGDGVVRMNGLDPLWEHGVGVVVILCLLPGHTGQHDCIVDLWIFLLQPFLFTMYIGIKLSLASHIEHINTMADN